MASNGTITMQPGQGYVLYSEAERLRMTVSKLLTGKDMPLVNLDRTLTNTYHLAKQKLEKQQRKGKRRR